MNAQAEKVFVIRGPALPSIWGHHFACYPFGCNVQSAERSVHRPQRRPPTSPGGCGPHVFGHTGIRHRGVAGGRHKLQDHLDTARRGTPKSYRTVSRPWVGLSYPSMKWA